MKKHFEEEKEVKVSIDKEMSINETSNDKIVSDPLEIRFFADKIKDLLLFSATLVPHIEILEESLKEMKDRMGFSQSAHPLLMAIGANPDEEQMNLKIQIQRSEAIINLIKVIKETEDFRADQNEKSAQMKRMRESLGY